jgi:DNA-binding PadR family transcriptional regulator
MATAKNVKFEYDGREISLIDLLPIIYHNILDYHAITDTSATELSPLYRNLSKLLNDQFISTASEEVIAKWEKYLDITPNGTDTLDERRFRIHVELNDTPPYTDKYLINKLDNLCGKGLWRWHRDYNEYTLVIEVSLESVANTESVINMVRNIIPANINLVVRNYRSRHSELGAFTHEELTTYTHDEIKYAEMFK